ncbi:hypothetical protein PsorP6_010951 [Peronosclerospora sorghi]|uniref:Uncharacterized protein n=1 Tax=Peronosclerospora sorghi TaxID=230839 RepID=A0ACC0VWW0_9STRA|nr:hypothetical protein PsorP6_010951 [Peronosclerospora sorghi]
MLAAVALTVSITEAEEGKRYGPMNGGSRGDFYSNGDKVQPGQIVTEVRLYGAERVEGFTFVTRVPGAAADDSWDVGRKEDERVLRLGKDEHITKVEYCSNKFEGATSLVFLELTTNKNNTISAAKRRHDCGGSDEAPFGYQLSSFYGYYGSTDPTFRPGDKQVIMTGAIWTSVDTKPPIIAIP